jgi:hypothetical protein
MLPVDDGLTDQHGGNIDHRHTYPALLAGLTQRTARK